MSQLNKRPSTSSPTDPPVKRKRGRPRKDENVVQKEKPQAPQPPLPDHIRGNQRAAVDPSDHVDDQMIGQMVTGVVEGIFDAGLFVSVKTASSNIPLRGVVFHQGRFAPITAANDVAPQARMYTRRELPIPAFNPQQGQANGSVSGSEKNEKPVHLEKLAPVVPTQVLPSNLQSGSSSFALANQSASASASVPPTATWPEHVPNTSLGGKNVPDQNSKFGLEKQSAPQLQSVTLFTLANQSGAFKAPLTENLLKNDLAATLGGKDTPQQISEAGIVNQSTPQLQSGAPFTLANQYSFGKAPLTITDSLPKNDLCPSLEVKNLPQQKSEFGPENQFTHQLSSGTPFGMATQSTAKNITGTSLGGKNLPQQQFESALEKQSILQLQSGTPFPFASGYAPVTVPLTDSLPKSNSGASMGGIDVPEQKSDSALDNQAIPQLQAGAPFALANPSASVIVSLTDNLPKDNLGASSKGKDMPQKNFDSLLNSQPILQLQTDIPFTLANPSASVAVPATNKLPKNDSLDSLGEKNMPQQNSEFGLENRSTPQLDNKRSTEQDEIVEELEASSTPLEKPKIGVERTRDAVQEIDSELSADMFPAVEQNISEVPQGQNQAVDSGNKSSESAHDELKSRNPELSQSLAGAKSVSLPLEKPLSPKSHMPQILQQESTKNSGRDEIVNGEPVTNAAGNTNEVSQSAERANEPMKIMEEETPPKLEVNDAGESFPSLRETNQPETFMQEKAGPSEPEVAAEGTRLPEKSQMPSL